jgi:hypothetical protein
MFRKMSFRTLLLFILILILAAATYGFANTNTINGGSDTYAGEGSGTISGYAVTGITYTLDASYPSNITTVVFTLDQSATTVRAAINDGAVKWADSCVLGGGVWTCTFTTSVPTTLGAGSLIVVAAQ